MKRLWILFFIAGFICTNKVNAAVPENQLSLAAVSKKAGSGVAQVPKSILTETVMDIENQEDGLKITNSIKNGFYQEDGWVRYYEKGKVHTGFLTSNGRKYYFDPKGNMVTGEQKIKKACYDFGTDGVMRTGFVAKKGKDSEIKVYYDEKGRLKTGTFQVDTVQYQASEQTGEIYSVKNLSEIVCQRPELPTGCEITSWTMMANYAGISIGKTEAADEMPVSSDPNQGFVGSPYSSEGGSLVIFPGGLADMTQKYFGSYVNMTGCSYEQIEAKLNDKRLVVVWVTRLDGFGSHTVALTGYDRESLYYNDPWTGEEETISREYFETIWAENGHMAMSY